MALRQGDDTALRLGRLTFNPLAHIDPIGTVILPALCLWRGLPLLGWAKPVPVDPANFNQYRKAMVRVAAAGPAANLLLCVAAAVLARSLWSLPPVLPGFQTSMVVALRYAMIVNLTLAFFNLIPVHPLDGSRIVSGLLPWRWSMSYERHAPYGVAIILALLFLGFLNYLVGVPATVFLLLLRSVGLA
ncbi:MAG: site-2 protease family protein [Elusimicrobia bacterium]|nr:site-2 protease family protein [Elusimicrobiota bacterium]